MWSAVCNFGQCTGKHQNQSKQCCYFRGQPPYKNRWCAQFNYNILHWNTHHTRLSVSFYSMLIFRIIISRSNSSRQFHYDTSIPFRIRSKRLTTCKSNMNHTHICFGYVNERGKSEQQKKRVFCLTLNTIAERTANSTHEHAEYCSAVARTFFVFFFVYFCPYTHNDQPMKWNLFFCFRRCRKTTTTKSII